MARRNIALIGFMCAGKSTVGRGLAMRTGRTFVETDALVEQRAGMSIAEVFSQFGEEGFREIEAEVVSQVAALENCVVSCGGGVVLRSENVAVLKESAVVVYLDVAPETVLQRMGPRSRVRPLLSGADREERVTELMRQRRPVYASAADVTVRADGLPVEQVVRVIEERLKRI